MSGLFYYNRKGDKISLVEWGATYGPKSDQRFIANTILSTGRRVSTVLLGLDHNFGMGRPLIFETMVFVSNDNLEELACVRDTTEKQARITHVRLVREFTINPEGSQW